MLDGLTRLRNDEWQRLMWRVRPRWLDTAFPSILDREAAMSTLRSGELALISQGSINLRSMATSPSSGAPPPAATLRASGSSCYVLWEPHGLLGLVMAAARAISGSAVAWSSVQPEVAFEMLRALPEPFCSWGQSESLTPPASGNLSCVHGEWLVAGRPCVCCCSLPVFEGSPPPLTALLFVYPATTEVDTLLELLSIQFKLRILIVMAVLDGPALRQEYSTRHFRNRLTLVLRRPAFLPLFNSLPCLGVLRARSLGSHRAPYAGDEPLLHQDYLR
jgi:hypothetical protein